MPTELHAADPFIDALVADLLPVRPRQWTHEAALLLGLVAIEIMLFIVLDGVRPDMVQALATPIFWWKSGSLALLAGLAIAAVLVSLDPAMTRNRSLSRLWLGLAVSLALGLGWLIDAGASDGMTLLARLDWREGLDCLFHIMILSLPLVAALTLIMRRGAATQPGRTALAAGLAAAGLGAFIFAFHCPHDDPLYVMVWYGGGILLIGLTGRLLLPRLSRW